jgi:hypothetical protein
MQNPSYKKRAVRPVPLAVLGLMFGILGLMYQLNTVFYQDGTDKVYLLWGIGFAIVAWATWGQLTEPSVRHD